MEGWSHLLPHFIWPSQECQIMLVAIVTEKKWINNCPLYNFITPKFGFSMMKEDLSTFKICKPMGFLYTFTYGVLGQKVNFYLKNKQWRFGPNLIITVLGCFEFSVLPLLTKKKTVYANGLRTSGNIFKIHIFAKF